MPARVGLLVGGERAFPGPFLETLNRKGFEADVSAEMVRLGGATDVDEARYAVLVDRISHRVPYYRAHLQSAAASGTAVVNDPFWSCADQRFFQCTLARRLGLRVPRTALLPNKAYHPGLDPAVSLRNLEFPLDWGRLLDFVGLPALLKPNHGPPGRETRVSSQAELLAAYDRSGRETMVLQESPEWDDYLRCICVGRREVLAIRYETRAPAGHRYRAREALDAGLQRQAAEAALLLVEALGYDVDAVEFGVRGGLLHTVDLLDPVPDLDELAGDEGAIGWVLDRLSDLALGYALRRAEPPWRRDLRWWRFVDSA
jgi:hypothetical protein